MIPTTNKRVHLDLLHPRFKIRLEHFFTDPRTKGRVSVSSAGRSYATQKRLYNGYRAGKRGYNLAANPDWKRPGGFFVGSLHQEQKDGYCYAVDFSNLDPKSLSNDKINEIAESYGIVATIKDREWWHHQPRSVHSWFKPTAFKEARADTKPLSKPDLKTLREAIDELGATITNRALRKGSRGVVVKTAQIQLGHVGFDAGYPDGIFGRKTKRAVKGFQRWQRLTVDGIIGPHTWARLFRPEYFQTTTK
mgnify:CR=1 FL=1